MRGINGVVHAAFPCFCSKGDNKTARNGSGRGVLPLMEGVSIVEIKIVDVG